MHISIYDYVVVLKCPFDGERLLSRPFTWNHLWIVEAWNNREVRVSVEHDSPYAIWAVTTYNGTEYAFHGDYIVNNPMMGLIVIPKTVFEVYFSD